MLHSFEVEARQDRNEMQAIEGKKAFLELAQQYHLLCNIIDKTRHSSPDFLTCDEATCKVMISEYVRIWGND